MNVSTLPFGPTQRRLLINAGFSDLEDFKDVTPTQLSEELEITCEEALDIIKTIKNFTKQSNGSSSNSSHPTTAFDLLEKERSQGSIVTFCEDLDEMLGGGVPVGKITEFCGAPGVGKTQMGMQLAVDVQIPKQFGGLEGKAIYIDTEGSFIVERVCNISAALVRHLNDVNETMHEEVQSTNLADFTVENILSNIHLYRCHDYVQLIALSHLLPDIIKVHNEVKLIVVDSIAFPFRHDFDDLALRTRILNGLAQSFIKLAYDNDLSVVFMNQMTTKVRKDKFQQSGLVPALGESWGHACTIRIILFWEGNSRLANLYKSPSKKEMTVPFQITSDGIRSVPHPTPPEQPDHLLGDAVSRSDRGDNENTVTLKRTFDEIT